MGAGIWVQSAGCGIGLPVMPVVAVAGARGLTAGVGVGGRDAHASRAFVQGSRRARPPAGCRRGTGLGGRAGRAGADREAPHRPDLEWLGRIPGLWSSRVLRPGDAFRAASVTKSVTAAVAVRLAHQERLALDGPLAGQLAPELLDRWSALDGLPRTTPRQLLAHTAGLPNYFTDQAFAARLREEPGRACVRPSWLTMRLRTGRRAFLPAGALSTAIPATWSPGSWWSR